MKEILVATIQCASCQHQWTVREGEIPADDYPLCVHCGSPGILLKAEVREINSRDDIGESHQ